MLAIANATIGEAVQEAAADGWLNAAIDGFGCSWAFWLATGLAVRLALRAAPAPASGWDLAVGAASLAVVALPADHIASCIAAPLAGAWFAWRAGPDDPRLRAGALLLAALAADLVWVNAAMVVAGAPIEALDARASAWFTGAVVHGNAIAFLHGGGGFYVARGCTSINNIALALLLWFAVTRSARPRMRRGDLAVAAALALSVAALNTGRLALMSLNAQTFHLAHGATGSPIFDAAVTTVSLAWALWDVRKELFDPVLDADAGPAGHDRGLESAAG
ncbi:MAG TPA: hypothetical protein VHW60_15865 [Caulobacteraceae bacterium]|nr:hypothetical protein [Caulobacteraceae bacterium]